MPLHTAGKEKGRKEANRTRKPKTVMIRVDEKLTDVVKQLKQEIAKKITT